MTVTDPVLSDTVASTINGISGKKAQLNSRRSAQGKGSDASKEGNLPTLIQPPSPQVAVQETALTS